MTRRVILFSEARLYTLPFGKYCGQRLDDIARTDEGLLYLDWLVGQDWLRDRARDCLKVYLSDGTIAMEVSLALDKRRRS